MNGIDISKVLIIAEAGVNHNGRLELARKLVDAAVEAKADIVKFQTFRSGHLVSRFAGKAEHQEAATTTESQLQMLKRLELSFEDFTKVKAYCDKKGIIFLSTPYDCESVDFLEPLVSLYKIGSGELTNLPFLEYVSAKGKPLILSTGMSDLAEVREAVDTVRNTNPSFFLPVGDHLSAKAHRPRAPTLPPLVLLHCITKYPADFGEVNLKAMLTLRETFGLPVGHSDHTLGIEVPVAAVALGAKIIEKHFTVDRNLPGPDHKASLAPPELKMMVTAIRNTEKALGDGIKRPVRSELKLAAVARRSLVAKRNMEKGERVKESDVAIKRPGTGIPAKLKHSVVGKELKKNIREDELFRWEDLK